MVAKVACAPGSSSCRSVNATAPLRLLTTALGHIDAVRSDLAPWSDGESDSPSDPMKPPLFESSRARPCRPEIVRLLGSTTATRVQDGKMVLQMAFT
eukprot:6888045-Prymnesium_polylepis.1